jgi:hypothetical protein
LSGCHVSSQFLLEPSFVSLFREQDVLLNRSRKISCQSGRFDQAMIPVDGSADQSRLLFPVVATETYCRKGLVPKNPERKSNIESPRISTQPAVYKDRQKKDGRIQRWSQMTSRSKARPKALGIAREFNFCSLAEEQYTSGIPKRSKFEAFKPHYWHDPKPDPKGTVDHRIPKMCARSQQSHCCRQTANYSRTQSCYVVWAGVLRLCRRT